MSLHPGIEVVAFQNRQRHKTCEMRRILFTRSIIHLFSLLYRTTFVLVVVDHHHYHHGKHIYPRVSDWEFHGYIWTIHVRDGIDLGVTKIEVLHTRWRALPCDVLLAQHAGTWAT